MMRRKKWVGLVAMDDRADMQSSWAIGAPMGLSVSSVGTLQMTSPLRGLCTFSERKSL